MRSRRTITWAVVAVVLCATVGVVAAVRRASPAAAGDKLPTGFVKRGDLDMKVFVTGELRASHSEILIAPPIGGGALQLTHLLHTGAAVKKGELVMEFDPSEQHFKLDQNRSELLQAEQEITKAKADAAVVTAQDKVALLKARFDVRRAELDVQKNELVSKIDGDKNDLALQQAKRVMAEQEKDIESHKASGQAATYLAKEKYNKAKLGMDQAQQNLEKMHVTAPMDGLISIQLADSNPLLRSEFTANIVFLGGTKKNVLSLPRQALFLKDGKRIVYVKKDSGYDQREVKIETENESRAAISGLEVGSKVALIDPTAPRKTNGSGSAPGSAGGTP